jgi:hypothetical protein
VQRLRLGAGEPEGTARVLIAELERAPRDIGNGEMSGVELVRAPSGRASRTTRCSSGTSAISAISATSGASPTRAISATSGPSPTRAISATSGPSPTSATGGTDSTNNGSTSIGVGTNTFSISRRRHQPHSEDRQLESEAFAGVGIQIPRHIPPLVVKVRVRAVVTREFKRPRFNGASEPCAGIPQDIQIRHRGVCHRRTQ